MAKNYYELHVAGCTRQLPILPSQRHIVDCRLRYPRGYGDRYQASEELAAVVPKDTDIIMTAETKGIPLAAELARVLGMKRYIVARKSVKAYMQNPIWVEDESITTKGKQRLYLMDTDVEMLHGKNVLLLDDVISTGGSMKAMKALAEKAGAHVIGKAAILAEGNAAKKDDIIFLEKLPLFEHE